MPNARLLMSLGASASSSYNSSIQNPSSSACCALPLDPLQFEISLSAIPLSIKPSRASVVGAACPREFSFDDEEAEDAVTVDVTSLSYDALGGNFLIEIGVPGSTMPRTPPPVAVTAMRMYTLWKVDSHTNAAARLEHEGMPVLFELRTEAEADGRPEVEE